MTKLWKLAWIPLILAACNKDDATDTSAASVDDTGAPSSDDTGATSDDTGETQEPCTATVDEIDPDGDDDWFYRDPLTVEFVEDGSSATFTLTDAAGTPVTLSSTEWNTDNTEATLSPEPLEASTAYTLTVEVCDTTSSASFTTSEYGAPVEGGYDALVGRTWVIEMGDLNYTEPPGVGVFLSALLDAILLIGVLDADEGTSSLDMHAAQGTLNNEGDYVQRIYGGTSVYMPTWDFPGVDYSSDPYFIMERDEIEILYDGVKIPMYDLHVEGTFAPDGTAFSGGKFWAMGDTRNMWAYFGTDEDPNTICALVGKWGLSCETCPSDGEAYCLFLKAEDVYAPEQEDLTLTPSDGYSTDTGI